MNKDLREAKNKRKKELLDRVMECRIAFIRMDLKHVQDKFIEAYPQHAESPYYFNNVYYGNIVDEQFTKDLEEFTQQQKQLKEQE